MFFENYVNDMEGFEPQWYVSGGSPWSGGRSLRPERELQTWDVTEGPGVRESGSPCGNVHCVFVPTDDKRSRSCGGSGREGRGPGNVWTKGTGRRTLTD